nr:GTPase domain-containing protein [uncultured Rhodopila sp.]
MWRIIAVGLGILVSVVGTKLAIDHWKKVRETLGGKKIAVLGPRASGKTTLIKFLLKGELSEEYVATAKPEKFSGKKVVLQDLNLTIEDTTDVPGDRQSHADWERLYKEADFVLYLTDAKMLHAGDQGYENNVRDDMRHIGEWFDDRKDKPPRFFLIATHCDLIFEYDSLPDSRKTAFTDDFWKTPIMQQLILLGKGIKNVKCVAGSLKGRDESERLVGSILRQATA